MSKYPLLNNIDLFKGLSKIVLDELVKDVHEQRYKRGEYIYMEGQPRDAVYFVQHGLVKVYTVDSEGREHIISIAAKGHMFPLVGFFEAHPYSGTAAAMSASTILSIRSAKFEELLIEYPDLMKKVMRMMGTAILQLQTKIHELAVYDSHQRVYALLRQFAQDYGRADATGIHIKIPFTHSEIAQMVGLRRESVSRIWNDLRRSGILTREGDEWLLNREWVLINGNESR